MSFFFAYRMIAQAVNERNRRHADADGWDAGMKTWNANNENMGCGRAMETCWHAWGYWHEGDAEGGGDADMGS